MATSMHRQDPAFWIALAVAVLILAPFGIWVGFWGGFLGPRFAIGAGWTVTGIIGVGLAALALVFVAKALSLTPAPVRGTRTPAPPSAEPRAILDGRYAKGEITRDEYLRMRADLEGPAR